MNEDVGAEVAQLVAQLLAGRDNERLELIDGLGARQDRTAARDQQHANRFAIAALARVGEMVARERLVRGGGRRRARRTSRRCDAPAEGVRASVCEAEATEFICQSWSRSPKWILRPRSALLPL